MGGGREVAAGVCAGTGDGNGSSGKLSGSPGQTHGMVCVFIV